MPSRKPLPPPRRRAGAPKTLVLASGRTAAELSAAKAALSALEVTVARSLDDACRIIAERSPDVVLVDFAGAPLPGDLALRLETAHAGVGRAPRVVFGALDDVTLLEGIVELARVERAERAVADDEERLHAAQAFGRTAQWQHDPEARSFAWLTGGSARFDGLDGEGSVDEQLLRFVHPDDRTRVAHAIVLRTAAPIEYRLALPSGEQRELVQHLVERRDHRTGRRVTLGTVQDVTEARQEQRELEQLAHYDAATGLPNRTHAVAYLEAALQTARRRSASVAVLSVGVDAFRTMEDTFGRSATETVFREVAARLRGALEEGPRSDRGSDGLTARHGQYELLVVLRDASAEDAAGFFQRASERLAAPIALEGTPIVVTCSAGVAVASHAAPLDGPTHAETMLARADAALHVAMTKGRGGLVVHAQEMQQALERKQVVEQRLRDSLASGSGLELHYQPKVETGSHRVRAVEALLRSSPDPRGPVSPLELVSVAEERGLVHALGDFVLRTACAQARCWEREGRWPLRVAVNVSAHQLARAGFVDEVASVLAETELSPQLLELEITEGAMMADVEGARVLLARLKGLGVRIALDDFGTGYSSLAYLTRLPIDTLKIDRSFVMDIGVSRKGEAILSAFIALSHSLGLEVVAEGVETAAQEAFLARHGDLEIQGWLYSKALPARELTAWLEQHQVTWPEPVRRVS